MAKSEAIPSPARSWTEAKLMGAKTYHGKVCKVCGTDVRRFPKSGCVLCGNEKARLKGVARTQAKPEAKEQARLDLMAEEGTENILAQEEAERLAKAEAKKEKEQVSRRRSRAKKMAEVGTDDFHEQDNARQRDWYARTGDVRRAKRRERTSKGIAGYRMIRLRTPPWLTDDEHAEMQAMYDQRDKTKKEEVDHKVPIHDHPDIAGLHVPWNLQVLTRAKNRQRSRGRVAAFTCTPQEAAAYVACGMAVWKRDIGEDGSIDWSKYPRPPR
ncbi:MAG: hypothetical protein KF861_02075 [Planctomycetaceae bacterium]|nr:hypothetical protein [Planctomycetaceae bacterium]